MTAYLAIEGGGTRSVAGFYLGDRLVAEATAGPSNPLAYGASATAGVIVALASRLVPPEHESVTVLAGIAGVVSHHVAESVASQLRFSSTLKSLRISTDLHPLLYAHVPDRPGILAIAGTGSSVLSHDGRGAFQRIGGRGTVMGDDGSAYQIAVAALRAVARAEDGVAPQTALQQALPEYLKLVDVEALVPWSLTATKQDLAALAHCVASIASEGDPVAQGCIRVQAERLAEQVTVARKRLGGTDPVPLYTQGGVVEQCDLFRQHFFASLGDSGALIPTALCLRGHAAVLHLAQCRKSCDWCFQLDGRGEGLAPTEGQSDAVPALDTLDSQTLTETMIAHEARVGRALTQQAIPLARVTDCAGASLRAGGRILYLGAGTSGRLGVLDASECPPTFGTAPEQVMGIIAGGEPAIRVGVEGAEDNEAQGRADVAALVPTPQDIVIGIAASGTTPYVHAALAYSRKAGATTVLLCCNPLVTGVTYDHVIALPTGPEALPGSTRLNAGTATKVALNIISTGAMALSGYIYRGYMVKMRPSNIKLRARAERMVQTLAGCSPSQARDLLVATDYDIPTALLMARHHVDVTTAQAHYHTHAGQLHSAMEEVPPT